MSADTFPDASLVFDLPPRTWRGWWLDRPKWLRIGVWAAMVVISLQAVLAVRILIGLIESPEIRQVRQDGGIVLYPWRNRMNGPFPGALLLMDGLRGRSARNVHAVVLPHEADETVERCVDFVPAFENHRFDRVAD